MNRLNTYPISEEARRKEPNTIKNTIEDNKYDRNKSKTQPNPKKQSTNNEPQTQESKMGHIHIQWEGNQTNHYTI
jgi:hypothetical protein